MLILLAVLAIGVFLFSRIPRLERASEMNTDMMSHPNVRAYVDGKPVKSHLMEK